MKALSLAAAALAAFIGLAACKSPAPASPPRIVSFTAEQNEIFAGTSVTLSYEVEGATEVTLISDTGESIPLTGDSSRGGAIVAPVFTRFYLLRASSEGRESTAFVQVSVGEPLKEVFLIAVPPSITAGDSAQLLWGARGQKMARITATVGDITELSGDSGSVVVKPSRSTSYSLFADPGTGGPALTASVELRVAPKISAFTAKPRAAHAGEVMTLSWSSAGGTSVMLTEKTFGQVFASADPLEVADGSYAFTVPTTTPNGTPVQDGLPLEFVLRVSGSAPDSQATAKLAAYVGAPPQIVSFTVPAGVTLGKSFTTSWKTTDAVKVEVFAAGLRVFASLPGDQATVDEGSVQLPSPNANATYELVATNALGVTTRRTSGVAVYAKPQIDSFFVPTSVGAGSTGLVSWTTQGANRVTLRMYEGPNVHVVTEPATVAAGTVTLSFGTKVRLTLEAMNGAGEVVQRTSDVIPGTALSATTSVASSLAEVPLTVSWDASALLPTLLEGMPNATPDYRINSTSFVDLLQQANATELTFEEASDGVKTVKPGRAFRFPFFGGTHETFDVQMDGIVGLTPQRPAGLPTGLPSKALGSALLPFWDDLELGANGKVHWYLDETDYPRRLIIQWSNVHRAQSTGATQLTFQVQLFESGAFKYVYGQLSGPGSDGVSATIGVQSYARGWEAEHQVAPPATKVITGCELSWFFTALTTGSFAAQFSEPTSIPVLGVAGSGRRMIGEARVRAFAPGSVAVTEVMAAPEPTLTNGRWVELQNHSPAKINVDGLVLRSNGSDAGFPLPEVELEPGGVLMLGESLDPALTGGASVDHVWSDVPLSPASDDVRLVVENGVVSSLSYSVPANGEGRAISAPQPYAYEGVQDGGVSVPLSCPGNETFGTAVTSYGTPGAANPSCLPYRVERIPADFEDLTQTRGLIFVPSRYTPTQSNQVVEYQLDGGFEYFGTRYFTAWVSTNGFISFGTALDQPVNRTVPSSFADAQGMIAPFWDDFDYFTDTRGAIYAERVKDHWTFQWADVAHASFTADHIHAEAKLFDDGRIEFHYGESTNGSSALLGFGSSATAWCEMPGRARALAISRNQPLLLPSTAYRFVPLP